MTLDPTFAALLDQLASSGVPPFSEMTVEQARTLSAEIHLEGESEAVASVVDRTIDTETGPLPVRVYRPESLGTPGIVVWFHGGGWVMGSLDFIDTSCRRLANGSESIIVSVDYRLAPEHRFPAAVEDAWAALRWVAEHGDELGGDRTRLAVGGDSAGANLATVVALMARDAGGPALQFQALSCPALDFTFSQPSYVSYGEGYLLTADSMRAFRAHYLGEGGPVDDWRASPLLAPDVSGVAPAHIVCAQYDPLHDEAVAYARRLEEAGVPVVLEEFAGMIHGFPNMGGVTPVGVEATASIAKHLREALQ